MVEFTPKGPEEIKVKHGDKVVFHIVLKLQKGMSYKVELIPISEGNRITVKENEKILIGRGSSLGVC